MGELMFEMSAMPTPEQLGELVRCIARAEEDALETLYSHTSSRVYAMALRILRDPAQAEEVALDVYTQVWQTAGDYSSKRGSVMAWLIILVRSRALDRLRSLKSGIPEVGSDPLGRLEANAQGPEEDAQSDEVTCTLQAALARLSEKQRQALQAAFFAGMTHTEIARAHDLPLGTVKRRIRGGLEQLREILGSGQEEWA